MVEASSLDKVSSNVAEVRACAVSHTDDGGQESIEVSW